MVFKKVIFSFFLFCSLNILVAQTNPLNIQQFAHIPNSGFMVPSELNDIWGWVDSAGNEYAIVGMNDGTSIIDLSDPLSPQEVLFVPGMNSIWRDIKTYGNYAYVTTEAMNGLLIIDLSNFQTAPTPIHIFILVHPMPSGKEHIIYILTIEDMHIFLEQIEDRAVLLF